MAWVQDPTRKHVITRKVYRRGTHRTARPADTIARVEACRHALGITRLANVTGLDYLGIPVFMATRPNARAISVAQGKGHDEDCAMASALMEAAEVAHAETPNLAITRETAPALSKRAAIARLSRLPRRKGARLEPHRAIDWVIGKDLLAGKDVFVPFDLVHTDFTKPASELFVQTSNGLASGNHLLEATIAGLCEVIERDATHLFEAKDFEERASLRIRTGSVRERDTRALIDRLEDSRMSLAIWDTTSDVGVASFLCRLVEADNNRRSSIGPFWGAGCHLDRSVALSRAITEAAQARLTFIAGSRDDLFRRIYRRHRPPGPFEAVLDLWEHAQATRSFYDVPSCAGPTLEEDLETILSRLKGAGLAQIVVVDLTNDTIGIPVVRVIVPGLAGHDPLRAAKRAQRRSAPVERRAN